MAASSVEEKPPTLPQLFLRGWEARRKLDACELTTRSPEHSACVAEGTAALERATELASTASLFSDNEDLDEVSTSSLKYLLLPALLGELTLQRTEGERVDAVLKARVYFIDYLKRCRSYGVTKDDPPPAPPPSGVGGASSVEQSQKTYHQLAAEREEKIRRLREKKELERRTEELSAALNEGGKEEEEEEEEEGREKWVAMLQLNVYRSREFVKSIDGEIPLLRHMEAVRKGEGPLVAKRPEASGRGPPTKPLVITREMLRGGVFGAGYPSVPTMSVEEFYRQRYGEGGGGEGVASGRKEGGGEGGGGGGGGGGGEGGEGGGGGGGEEEEEKEEEEDSEEAVKKAREWDEFKDENRRGWGNKKNMG